MESACAVWCAFWVSGIGAAITNRCRLLRLRVGFAQLLHAATAGSADCGVATGAPPAVPYPTLPHPALWPQVLHQRYLLQPTALEVFLSDRSNALLNLPSAEVRVACSLLAMLSLHRLSLSERRSERGCVVQHVQ